MSKFRWGSIGLSLLVLVVLLLWLLSGEVKTSLDRAPEAVIQPSESLMSVLVETRAARWYTPTLTLQGQLEPWRRVEISARVAGTVEALPVRQGQRVRAGEVLVQISEDNRRANVDRWRAKVNQLTADLQAADRLRSGNLVSRSEKMRLESELAASEAELGAARLALANLTPTAPFDGIVNHRRVELGSFLQVGQPLLELVQIDRLKATGQLPQQSVGAVSEGQPVNIRLLDGRHLAGEVSFVASAADPATRSFAVEVTVRNPGQERVAGGSATLAIQLPEQKAMFLSPAYLTLGDDGRPGVSYVDHHNRVVFTPVTLLSLTTEGAWVTGLPDEIRLITRGAGFVSTGQEVLPVDVDAVRG
ncbi:efflux RND transporter periplasmic adaptor subunit [Marinobacter sp. X15-166B]|uniref:efflux RND transporter periplasmic adaptor subunit n=1 Tax=Marinobacter sp. X15-166B TaxID=1897620 RepID=UPI00085C9B9F|nr:efflux RND transporter periplasmic adaptor subunit [Marinobacter sp. X15-166B]OEY66945.1 efflux transporter periplasmic adaptor subunit [Marinobacter sp. X15-166B]